MAALSNYLENKVIDWLLRGQSFTPPATVYVALHTGDPTDAGAANEVTGGSYARVGINSTLSNWAGTQAVASTVASTGTSGTTSNNAAITFPSPTGNWGTVTHMAVYDASTVGNMLFYAPLAAPKNVNNGDAPPSFPAATLTFQIDN